VLFSVSIVAIHPDGKDDRLLQVARFPTNSTVCAPRACKSQPRTSIQFGNESSTTIIISPVFTGCVLFIFVEASLWYHDIIFQYASVARDHLFFRFAILNHSNWSVPYQF